jgi:hypothetical protein
MKHPFAVMVLVSFAACASSPLAQEITAALRNAPSSYAQALRLWSSAEDINAWIGARFEYDSARALLLSETQRSLDGRATIYGPEQFFGSPSGICVDLARFAVETLRAVDARAGARYLMIEFEPVSIGGNTLRRHWIASFEREGGRYFFGDAKRPGFIAGPYASTEEFLAEYARYRGRQIVSFRELDSYERKAKTRAVRQAREARP